MCGGRRPARFLGHRGEVDVPKEGAQRRGGHDQDEAAVGDLGSRRCQERLRIAVAIYPARRGVLPASSVLVLWQTCMPLAGVFPCRVRAQVVYWGSQTYVGLSNN